CLYISIKYFLTLAIPCSFDKLFADASTVTPEMMKNVEAYEWFLLHTVFQFKIYRPTVYETADAFNIKLSSQQNANLLFIYTDSADVEMPLDEFFLKCAHKAEIAIDETLKLSVLAKNSGSPKSLRKSPVAPDGTEVPLIPGIPGSPDGTVVPLIPGIPAVPLIPGVHVPPKQVVEYVPTAELKINNKVLLSAVAKKVDVGMQTSY